MVVKKKPSPPAPAASKPADKPVTLSPETVERITDAVARIETGQASMVNVSMVVRERCRQIALTVAKELGFE